MSNDFDNSNIKTKYLWQDDYFSGQFPGKSGEEDDSVKSFFVIYFCGQTTCGKGNRITFFTRLDIYLTALIMNLIRKLDSK